MNENPNDMDCEEHASKLRRSKLRWCVPTLQFIPAHNEKILIRINCDFSRKIQQTIHESSWVITNEENMQYNKWNPLKEGIFIWLQSRIYAKFLLK